MPDEQLTETAGQSGAAELDQCAVATSCALLWGLGIAFLAGWVRLFSRDREAPLGLGRVYPGYRATACGSLIGAAWALVDGFIGGWLYAWLYNVTHRILQRSKSAEQQPLEGDE